MATVRVDRDLCLEAGQCTRILPELFVLDGSGPVRLAGELPDGPRALSDKDTEPARRAALTCPSAAIAVAYP